MAAPTITAQPTNQYAALGGTATFSVSATGSAQYSDTFVRANANPIGGSWVTPSGGFTALQIVSNTVTGTVNGTSFNAAYYNASTSNDQSSQITVSGYSASDSGGVVVRMQSGSSSGYVFISDHTAGTVKMYRFDSNVPTQLGSNVTQTVNVGDVIRLEVAGSTLTGKINGATVITQTDSTYASGYAGIYTSWSSFFMNNWSGGGALSLSYQWKLGAGNIGGATSASYTTPTLDYTYNGGSYSVVVSDSNGSVTSNSALLTISGGNLGSFDQQLNLKAWF